MKSKILLAYASTHGSTQEVAEFMAGVLREQGQAVDLQPARNTRSLEGYSAVILGAPLYMFRWHKDARRFLSQHRKVLGSGVPVAIFAGGPFDKASPDDWEEIRKRFNQELAQFTWLKPVSIEIIGGKFDPAHLRFPYNLIPALKAMQPSDLRDWEAIRAWAINLVALFQPVSV